MSQTATTEARGDDAVDAPSVGEFVELTFDGDESPLKGRVTDVDDNPEDVPATDLMVTIDSGGSNRHLTYAEGTMDGEDWSNVTRWSDFSGSHHLGDNAAWRVLE